MEDEIKQYLCNRTTLWRRSCQRKSYIPASYSNFCHAFLTLFTLPSYKIGFSWPENRYKSGKIYNPLTAKNTLFSG